MPSKTSSSKQSTAKKPADKKASTKKASAKRSAVKAPEPPAGVTLAAGTKLRLADRDVVLAEDATFTFEGMEREQVLVGMLHTSGNLEANRRVLTGEYDGLGNPVN